MANKIKGEISVKHEGKDYTLKIDMNVIAEIEDELDEGWGIFEGRMAAGTARVKHMRTVLFHSMRENHPEATVKLAGDILSEDAEVFGRLLSAAYPDAPADGETPEGNAPAAA